MSEDKVVKDEEEFFEFWITTTDPYGLNQDTWVCPSDRALERKRNAEKTEFFGSYVPTGFDKQAGSPFRWNQPWVIERGDFHGKGSHMLMPDGSIQQALNPFYGR
ncbi:MAG: hypothetical protein WD342_14080 [Verrucomicrobiales bacterium]